MNQILTNIYWGINNVLINSKNSYEIIYDQKKEILESYEMTLILMNISKDEDKKFIKMNIELESIESYIDYINCIIKELSNITQFKKENHNNDYVGNCFYFGNGCFYYNEEFLKYDKEQMFQIILNHMFHHLGSLYLLNDKNAILSYNLACFYICYNMPIKNLNSKFHLKNKNNFIIFSPGINYKQFIYKNINIFSNKYVFNNKAIYNGTQKVYKTYHMKFINNKICLSNKYIYISNKKILDIVNNHNNAFVLDKLGNIKFTNL